MGLFRKTVPVLKYCGLLVELMEMYREMPPEGVQADRALELFRFELPFMYVYVVDGCQQRSGFLEHRTHAERIYQVLANWTKMLLEVDSKSEFDKLIENRFESYNNAIQASLGGSTLEPLVAVRSIADCFAGHLELESSGAIIALVFSIWSQSEQQQSKVKLEKQFRILDDKDWRPG